MLKDDGLKMSFVHTLERDEEQGWDVVEEQGASWDSWEDSEVVVHRSNGLFWAGLGFCLTILVVASLVDVWAQSEANRMGFVFGQAVKKQQQLQEERKLLEVELASLRDPARLSRIARQELGLRQPRQEQLISEKTVKANLTTTRRVRLARARLVHAVAR